MSSVDPILQAHPTGNWITIGDGRYGSEAHYIESHGGTATATDIADDLLRVASEAGHISRYCIANAEALPFDTDSFDFACCKESAHHFPRPALAIYEMLRVSRRGAVFIEPADPYACLRQTEVPLTRIRAILNRLLTGRNQRNGFEAVGNYLYRFSVREIEKLAIGSGMYALAYKGINDFHGIPITKTVGGSVQKWKLTLTRILIRLQDLFSHLYLLQPVIYSFVIFKEPPTPSLLRALEKDGYQVRELPANPYLSDSSATQKQN